MLKYHLAKWGGVEMIQVTYQKRNGSIMKRYRNTLLPYKIGETTSMGWKVLNIEYEYKNKYYTYYDYNKLIYKAKQKHIKKAHIKELCLKGINTLLYYNIWFIILFYIKIRFIA